MFAEEHPGTRIERNIEVPEAAVSSPLKLVIYRNVETALRVIGAVGGAPDIRISLPEGSSARHWPIWLGWTLNCSASSTRVLLPRILASATSP